MGRRPWTILLTLLLGCGGPNETEEEPPTPAPAPQEEEVPAEATSAPYFDIVRTAMTAGPEAVLELYLAWDTAGYRFTRDGHGHALNVMSCFVPEEDCINPEAGWDMVFVVRGYSWEPVFVSPDSAAFEVTYDQIGALPQYPTSGPFRRRPPDTVWIRSMEEGWRLARPIRPHVSLARALDFSRSALDTNLVRQWRGSETR